MAFVVDASVTLAWCFEDEATDATEAVLDRLASETARTPALWLLEIANALLVAERRRRLTEFQAARFVELLEELPIEPDLTPLDLRGLLAIARRFGLSAYDAAYLLLAEQASVPLATTDAALRGAALKAGVPLVID
jgi:predicted nucleic acid-binding protein